jgi:hypothetical protein
MLSKYGQESRAIGEEGTGPPQLSYLPPKSQTIIKSQRLFHVIFYNRANLSRRRRFRPIEVAACLPN